MGVVELVRNKRFRSERLVETLQLLQAHLYIERSPLYERVEALLDRTMTALMTDEIYKLVKMLQLLL